MNLQEYEEEVYLNDIFYKYSKNGVIKWIQKKFLHKYIQFINRTEFNNTIESRIVRGIVDDVDVGVFKNEKLIYVKVNSIWYSIYDEEPVIINHLKSVVKKYNL